MHRCMLINAPQLLNDPLRIRKYRLRGGGIFGRQNQTTEGKYDFGEAGGSFISGVKKLGFGQSMSLIKKCDSSYLEVGHCLKIS